jgi:hypothetical protein
MFSILFENLKKVNEESFNPEDIFKPWSEEEIKELFIQNIKEQGCYQNDDGTWSSKGNVDLSSRDLKVIPVQFKEVGRGFDLFNNQLTSLEGCPKVVGGGFRCSSNLLTSLQRCPEKVGGTFWCWGNRKRFTILEVRKLCKVGGAVFV